MPGLDYCKVEGNCSESFLRIEYDTPVKVPFCVRHNTRFGTLGDLDPPPVAALAFLRHVAQFAHHGQQAPAVRRSHSSPSQMGKIDSSKVASCSLGNIFPIEPYVFGTA